jgi:hypothetical protein
MITQRGKDKMHSESAARPRGLAMS